MQSQELINSESFEAFAASKLDMDLAAVKAMLDEHEQSGFDRYNLAKCNKGNCFSFADAAEIWQAAIQSNQ